MDERYLILQAEEGTYTVWAEVVADVVYPTKEHPDFNWNSEGGTAEQAAGCWPHAIHLPASQAAEDPRFAEAVRRWRAGDDSVHRQALAAGYEAYVPGQ